MAKVLILYCFLLVVTLSRSAPISEEVDNDFDENDETQDDSDLERTNENEDDDYNDRNTRDNNYTDDDERDLKGKEDNNDSDEEDYKDGGDREVDISEEHGDREEIDDDNDDNDEDMGDSDTRSEIHMINAAAKNVVEDSEGNLALKKNSEPSLEEDDDMGDEEGEGEYSDMGKQISKLKKIFNEDMPMEIDELKSNSKALRENLDNLNAKLENFLRENGIKQDPAVPQSDSEHDYAYN